jgi:hypothetical protein
MDIRDYEDDQVSNKQHHRRSSEVYTFSNEDLNSHAGNVYFRYYAVNSFQEHLRFNLGKHRNSNRMHIENPDTPEAHPEILEKRQRRSSNHSSESNFWKSKKISSSLSRYSLNL